MTEAELWMWHSEAYAFRRVVLGVSANETTSPCDEEGIWYDDGLVRAAEQRYRAKFLDAKERRRQRAGAPT